jgi:signal transduction histidine kinase
MLSRWWKAGPDQPVARVESEDFVRSLSLILEPDALRLKLAARVRDVAGCDAVTFWMLRREDESFVSVPGPAAAAATARFSAGGTLARWLKINEEILFLPHPGGADQHLDDGEQRLLSELAARACAPVFAGSQLIGLLILGDPDPAWRIAAADAAHVCSLVRQAGLALQNADLQLLERERLCNVYRAEQLAVAGQLAATLSHEIRNPLTAIRSTVQYALTSDCEWDKKRRLLEGVLEAVDRIEQTIGGVLALTRADPVEFADIDLIKTVDDALLLTEAYARAHGIVVERQFEVVSLPVTADRRGLQQVCINLFLNACQAMPDGGRATLRCAVADPGLDSASALVQIRDSGQGIPAEDLPHVFDAFFTTKPGGTGLGLPICQDIVTRHKGRLRLESEPGRGTTASLLLPLRRS